MCIYPIPTLNSVVLDYIDVYTAIVYCSNTFKTTKK